METTINEQDESRKMLVFIKYTAKFAVLKYKFACI